MAIPSLLDLTVDGSTLVLRFSEAVLPVLPSISRFQVLVNGVRRTFIGTAVRSADGTSIRLTLSTPVLATDTVSVSYISVNGLDKPGFGDLRSSSTNERTSFFRNLSATNLTGPPATLTITSDRTSLRAGETATLTFTFSRDPGSSFSLGDVSVSGGSLSALSGTGLIRTAIFLPSANSSGIASLSVAAGSYSDAAGNPGGASNAVAVSFDTLAPMVQISSDKASLKGGESATISFQFSEDPGSSFSLGDVSVSGGSLSALSGTGLIRTAIFLPSANSSGIASLSVAAGSYSDAAGNPGGASNAVAVSFDATQFDVANAMQLRAAIQSAVVGNTINLTSLTPYEYESVTSLAKNSALPFTPGSGYAIVGAASVIKDTRILQEDADGPNGPELLAGTDQALQLRYTPGGAVDGVPLLSATQGGYRLDNIEITGTHEGWNGKDNVYMALRSPDGVAPVSVELSIARSRISVAGQKGFNPALASGGGAAFLQSLNNSGSVILENNYFDESGFRASFDFSGSPLALPGEYFIAGNTFSRSVDDGVVRSVGNRLQGVGSAELAENIFERGAYLDIVGDLGSSILFSGTNTFATIAGGWGIRADESSVGNPAFSGNARLVFQGAGIPLKYTSNADGVGYLLDATIGNGILVDGKLFGYCLAGGQGNDVLILPEIASAFITGDDGNDAISGSSQDDVIYGGAGNDVIDSSFGDDNVDGGDGEDQILGGAGKDILSGGSGNDTLMGGSGQDRLTGGVGSDVFRLEDATSFALSINTPGDVLADFSQGQDVIAIRLASLAPGAVLPAARFAIAADLTGASLTPLAGFSNTVIRITAPISTDSVATRTVSGLNNAYVLSYDEPSSSVQLFFDSNWGDTTFRRWVATLENVQNIETFSNANFIGL